MIGLTQEKLILQNRRQELLSSQSYDNEEVKEINIRLKQISILEGRKNETK